MGGTDGPDSSPSFPVPPDPGKGQEQCRRGRGWRLSRRGKEPLGVGRGRPGAQAPPLTPAGREGEAVASAQRARRGGERGGGGRPGTGWHPAGRSGLAANAVTCAVPPLAPASPALSIHKFSACSAATGHRSPPGTPRSRPPARPPWAARPGAEVGAAGLGIQQGGRGQAGAARPTGSPPALDHRPFPRGGEAGGREWGKPGRAWGPIYGALQPSLAAWRDPARPRPSPASVSPVRCSKGDGVFVSWISPKRRGARSLALCLSLRARHPAPGAGWGRGDGRGGERARGGPAGPQGRARGERPPSGLVSAYP